jgi:hypothetical protein
MPAADYKKGIELAKRRVREVTESALRDVAVEAGGVAIDSTPVLSGHLVSNWKLTTNAPATEEEDITSPARAGAKQRAIAAARGIQLGNKVFFANPTSYASFINDGTSKIQPRLMVELALAALPQIVERVRAKYRNGR